MSLDFRVLGRLKGFNRAERHVYVTVDPKFGLSGLDKNETQGPFNFQLDDKLSVAALPLDQDAYFIGQFARTFREWENPSTGKSKQIENHRFVVQKIEVVKPGDAKPV